MLWKRTKSNNINCWKKYRRVDRSISCDDTPDKHLIISSTFCVTIKFIAFNVFVNPRFIIEFYISLLSL